MAGSFMKYLHCEAEKGTVSLNTWQKLVNFFMYIKELISYNFVI